MKEKLEYIGAVETMATFTLMAPPVIDLGLSQKRYGTSVAVRTESQVGRNATCPCGSGLKNKKCCALKTIKK